MLNARTEVLSTLRRNYNFLVGFAVIGAPAFCFVAAVFGTASFLLGAGLITLTILFIVAVLRSYSTLQKRHTRAKDTLHMLDWVVDQYEAGTLTETETREEVRLLARSAGWGGSQK